MPKKFRSAGDCGLSKVSTLKVNVRHPKYCKILDFYSHAGEVSVLLGYELNMQCVDPEDDGIVIF